ncbi:MAG TPA: response regulator [Tepidisphaeraceae bacterium]|nr:response regulator [Tepidisphaeraceae bacterium]
MILIVEDHLDTGSILTRLLKRRGFEAIAVSSGSAALSLLQKTRPQVIILDKMMPGMDGLEVLRAIRSDAAVADIPVILYSANTDPAEMEKARRLGAQDYLIKASTPWERVCDTIRRYARA